MVEELKVQHHGFVAARKGSPVPHEADHEDDFIAHLEEGPSHVRNLEGSGAVEESTGERPESRSVGSSR